MAITTNVRGISKKFTRKVWRKFKTWLYNQHLPCTCHQIPTTSQQQERTRTQTTTEVTITRNFAIRIPHQVKTPHQLIKKLNYSLITEQVSVTCVKTIPKPLGRLLFKA